MLELGEVLLRLKGAAVFLGLQLLLLHLQSLFDGKRLVENEGAFLRLIELVQLPTLARKTLLKKSHGLGAQFFLDQLEIRVVRLEKGQNPTAVDLNPSSEIAEELFN